GRQQALAEVTGPEVNLRFVERSLYAEKEFTPRIGQDFPTFEEFCAERGAGSCPGGMVWERIASIEPSDYAGDVYDFTVHQPDHNSIANGFVVSNCGVRLVRSDLFYRDVKPHLRELVERLFANVPTGVGKSGRFSFRDKEMRRLLAEGSRYVIEKGL